MKKFKEALCFIIPLVVATTLSFIFFTLQQQGGYPVFSDMHYFELFLHDDLFWVALYNTYGKPFLFALGAILVLAVIRHFVKSKVWNRFWVCQLVNTGLGSVVSFALLLMGLGGAFDLPAGLSGAVGSTDTVTVTLMRSITVFEVMIALQTGMFAAFVFWILQSLWRWITSKRKAK